MDTATATVAAGTTIADRPPHRSISASMQPERMQNQAEMLHAVAPSILLRRLSGRMSAHTA